MGKPAPPAPGGEPRICRELRQGLTDYRAFPETFFPEKPFIYNDMLGPIKTEKLSNLIIHRISELIHNEKLESGDKLPSERKLAAVLSVSRTSVRQAIAALAAEGVLVIRHGGGTYVSELKGKKTSALKRFGKILAHNQIDPDEIIETRMIIECEAARLCALRADKKYLETIKKILDLQTKTVNASCDGENLLVNRDLHIAIAEGTGNKVLIKMMRDIWDAMESNMWPLVKREAVEQSKQNRIHRIQHEAIVKALCAGDSEGAYQAMKEHIASIKEGIDRFINDQA
jgi:GntR family transcriptional repressor for pyruvate dehydrogenase complex